MTEVLCHNQDRVHMVGCECHGQAYLYGRVGTFEVSPSSVGMSSLGGISPPTKHLLIVFSILSMVGRSVKLLMN